MATSSVSQGESISLCDKASQANLILLFAFAVFGSAFLLFQVQLIIAKYILPWFGGTPATFTTCILFFQIVLLLGYCYAHLIDVRLKPRTQAIVHSGLILTSMGVLATQLLIWGLPLLPGASWKPANSDRPLFHILTILSVSVGIPYFLTSTTGPLLQSWYGRTGSGTPYRLYGVSNAGSLLALLAYPIVFEPWLALRTQAWLWSAVFISFGCACIVLAWRVAARDSAFVPEMNESEPIHPPPNRLRKTVWLLLSAVASLSLLATTNQICQDVAVVPLLWVVPLSLYLVSFIVCFSSDAGYSRNAWSVALAIATLLVCFVLYHPDTGILKQILIYSFSLFATCMICHGELAAAKPAKTYVTAFYLYVAAGGAMGGLFVSIIAPFLFKGYWEFHLSVWLCWALLCFVLLRDKNSWIYIPKPLLLVFSLLLVFVGPISESLRSNAVSLAVCGVFVLVFSVFISVGNPRVGTAGQGRNAAVFSCALTLTLLACLVAYPPTVRSLGATLNARSFYGVITVLSDEVNGSSRNVLRHGRMTHGFQFTDRSLRDVPTGYYTPKSGIGLVLTNYPGRKSGRPLRIGVIGLGVGTLAAYGITGDQMYFYEINPDVVRLSGCGPKRKFTFLADSRAKVQVIPGDARIALEQELGFSGPRRFDILVIDAFSGDSIPVHLLTEEAFRLYSAHLNKPDGIMAFHISNNAVDLRPVITSLAAQSNMSAWFAQSDEPYRSAWIMVGAKNRDYPIPGLSSMQLLSPDPHFRAWTDDYSNLLQILRW